MYQQKWRRWIADQGCQFGFFEARIWNSGFFWTPLTFLGNQKARQNSSGKTLSELHIHYKSLLTRVRDHAGYKEYWNDFTVALKIIDVIYKKQMQDSVITGKENASKDWNCTIISLMFLTSFNIYFVFEYACFTWICLKTGIWLFLAFLGQFLFFFGENRLATMLLIIRAEVSRLIVALTEAMTNLFSNAHSVYLYYTIHM